MKGIGVSPGIAVGRAFVIKKSAPATNGIVLQSKEEIAAETERFNTAVLNALAEIEAIKNSSQLMLNDDEIGILETQVELINDPQIREDVLAKIETEYNTANDAMIAVTAGIVALFESMDDEYMRARSADFQDIGNRILKYINRNGETNNRSSFAPDTIIIADDLTPSDTITLDLNLVTGFATQAGSKTSHAAIIAKSKGLPAVVACGDELMNINHNDFIILDGLSGFVYVNPDEATIRKYSAKSASFRQQADLYRNVKHLPAITADGTQIKLLANISSADDMDMVFDNSGEGVGLFRTEMLFMDRDTFPDEEEQFEFYKKAVISAAGYPVTIRTIDIGGDKHLPYFNLPAELNPFLGYRAIRISLDQEALFLLQLKAILRAAAFGEVSIMFPMISNIKEIRDAKAILEKAKKELIAAGTAFDANIKVGIMVEIPSAAITADILAKEVDFFSIGTNDLCQYTLAVDRMNEKINHLYDPFNPGVLRLIHNVIEQGRLHNIHVGMCGEMASDSLATLLLLGMGLQEFSMSAASIPTIKNSIINTNIARAKQICADVMKMESSESITAYLKETTL
ncbi:phosphoenolpyruvate--protein phosphotransferase [Mucilaginibacter sp. ZT4R22]|uniref:Phosphoenolpyruvate-protein phosphotransferase n=1 Tax=Mucilaginibacter pankratovii TaxID=2772110 RepID=A0ABR7WK99_9SPHI|nr:phosphoenolpyruvate--protein phosphotransferase [Mucilaginibacter pankratovii]MBD1362735.1 phosphoenolpyruvate--protein phosphotransferase [Mucilaginibacter pankratovii]